jgi:hypothetical protein
MKSGLLRLVLLGLSFGVVALVDIAAIERSPEKNEYENLQVLPKDISSKELQHIMVDEFQDGLGVGCGFCHAQKKGSLLLDYASDEKPEKEIARNMMRMTMEINNKYFEVEKPVIGNDLLVVTCTSCHKGTPHPEKE